MDYKNFKTQLADEISKLNEEQASFLMDRALEDVSMVMPLIKDISKEELAYRFYRCYMIGFVIGKNYQDDNEDDHKLRDD